MAEQNSTANPEEQPANKTRPRMMPESEFVEMERYISDLEESVRITIALFDNGSVQTKKFGDLTLEALPEVMKLITSLYSTSASFQARIKGATQRIDLLRKYYDSAIYTKIKRKMNSSGTAKTTQRDYDTLVQINSKDYIDEEIEWDQLYARISACRDIFDAQMHSVEVIWRMQQYENKKGVY